MYWRVFLQEKKPGGHGDRASAAAAIELAIWDLNAKLRDEPAAHTLARALGTQPPTKRVPVYAAGGYYPPPGSRTRLGEELRNYAEQGYRHFKIKIGGLTLQEDIDRVQEAISVAGGGQYIAVDANGRFDIDTAMTFGTALAPLGLRWYEEPGDPLDYKLNHRLCEDYLGPVATGENLFSTVDVQNLLRYGGLRPDRDIVQMDPGLSYGVTEYLRMLDALEAAGFSRAQCMPHGGHLINLHVVAGLRLGGCEAYPQVFQPVGGFDEGTSVADAHVTLSDRTRVWPRAKSQSGAHTGTPVGSFRYWVNTEASAMNICVLGLRGAMGSIYAGSVLRGRASSVCSGDVTASTCMRFNNGGFVSRAPVATALSRPIVSETIPDEDIDLLIMAVKAGAVEEAAHACIDQLDRISTLLTIQNGLGCADIVASDSWFRALAGWDCSRVWCVPSSTRTRPPQRYESDSSGEPQCGGVASLGTHGSALARRGL